MINSTREVGFHSVMRHGEDSSSNKSAAETYRKEFEKFMKDTLLNECSAVMKQGFPRRR